MSDEALKFAAGLSEKPKYTVKEWEWFVVEMRNRVEKESWSGTDELEKAAWSFAVLKPSTTDSDDGKKSKRIAEAEPVEINSSVKRTKRK